jgi:hypothetical protein
MGVMMITRQAMNRRTLLRGASATLALPLLDAMMGSTRAAEAAATARMRLQVIYMPNGIITQNFRPVEAGEAWAMTPILKPLEPYREKFTVISGLAHKQAEALGDGGGDHGRCCGSYLTGVHVRKTQGADIMAGPSMDQLVARQFAETTQIASLELGMDPPSLVGSCDTGYSCAYTNTLSWSSPTTPLPVTINPRDVFERIFGDGDAQDAASRLARLRKRASILDSVMQDARKISTSISVNDQKKIDEYMSSIRDIERRIQKMEQGGDVAQADMARPAGIPDSFQDYARMMIDLQILASQADLTRVGTLMIGREVSGRSYPELGVPDAHHPLSHHGNDPEKMAKLTRINILHMEQVAYYLKRMNETKEGDGTLLDHTMLLAGASLGDPNRHEHFNLPTILAGGLVKGNRHLKVPDDTPMTNLLLSMMDRLGVRQERLGDSTGRLAGITA